MMLRSILSLALFACGATAFAQSRPDDWKCGAVKQNLSRNGAARTTVAHPDEDKYDVKYVKLNLSMTNVATTISGDVTTVARVVVPGMSAYVFEMLPPLVIDSVKIDGMLSTATATGDTVSVALPSALTTGDMFTAQVFYHGTPVSGTPSDIYGISTLQSPSWNNWVTFTLSEPYSAKDWWPCKQSLTDKIDSVDVWITVDDSLKAGSNGLLQAITPMGGGRNRYEWKHRYPIDYYLISASVGRYVDYSYFMHFTGSADTMLVQNYVYDNPLTLPFFKSVIDSTGILVDYFSSIYGRYPFWREKYGHCMAPLGGGEEHQTMTTLGYFQGWLVAHELGHQWFGDNVTCGTWRDITMNEGFASYSEILYYDKFYSHARALGEIVNWQADVMSEDAGSVYVDDTTSVARIFSRRLTYEKGACAIHTLRSVIDNDTYFFDLLRGWQTVMADSTGTIENFRDLAVTMLTAERSGVRFDTLFRQWFYGEGFPIYDVRWNQAGNDVYVSISQTTSAPFSVSLFTLPLELKLKSATGDTVIRVLNDEANQNYHFTWSKTMNGLTFDPNEWITDSSSVSHIVTLFGASTELEQVSVSPNPATTGWQVRTLPGKCNLRLTDVMGRTIWHSTASGTVAVPASDLAPGIYLLRISDGTAEKVLKVVKE